MIDLRTNAIDDFRIATLETGLPTTRWNVTASTDIGNIRFFGRFSCWAATGTARTAGTPVTWAPPPSHGCTRRTRGAALVDVEASVPLRQGATLALGVENALNTYPEPNPHASVTVGNRYGQFSPFGFNGAYYYGGLTYRWCL